MGCKDLYYVKAGDTIRPSDFLTKRQALKEIIQRARDLYEWEGLDTSTLDKIEEQLDSYSISETVMPDDHNIIRESLSELLVELGKIHDPNKLQELLAYLNDHVRAVKMGDIVKPDDHNGLVEIIETLCKFPSIRTGGLVSKPRYGLTQGIGAMAQYYPLKGYSGRFFTLEDYFPFWERCLDKPDEDPYMYFDVSAWDKDHAKIYVFDGYLNAFNEMIQHEKKIDYGYYDAHGNWYKWLYYGGLTYTNNRIYVNGITNGWADNFLLEFEPESYTLVKQKYYLIRHEWGNPYEPPPETPQTRQYVPTSVGYFHTLWDPSGYGWEHLYGNLGVRYDGVMERYYLMDEDANAYIRQQAILTGCGVYPRGDVLLFSAANKILQRVSADLSEVLDAYKFDRKLIRYDFTEDGRLILAFEGRHIVVADLELSEIEKYRVDIPLNNPDETEILDVRSCSDEIMILLHRGDWHIFVITDLDFNIKDAFGTLFFKWCYGYGDASYTTPCQDYPPYWGERELRTTYMIRDPDTWDFIGYTIIYKVPNEPLFYLQTSRNGYFGNCFSSHHQIAKIVSNPSGINYSPVDVSIHYVDDTDIETVNYTTKEFGLVGVEKECCLIE